MLYHCLIIFYVFISLCDCIFSLPLDSKTLDRNKLYNQQQERKLQHQQQRSNYTENRITLSPYANPHLQKNINENVSKVSQSYFCYPKM